MVFWSKGHFEINWPLTTKLSEKKEAAPEKVETSEVENAGDSSDPEISAQLAKIDELMDHSSEAIQTKQEQTSPDKIEPVVVETTTVEEKEVDETDIQVPKYFSLWCMCWIYVLIGHF